MGSVLLLAALAAVTLGVAGASAGQSGRSVKIKITSPSAKKKVRGATTIRAKVSGAKSGQVSFYVDGILVGTDSTPPYEQPFDSEGIEDGDHTFSATVSAGGSSASSNQDVTVGNADPPANTVLPVISGTPEVGQVLLVDDGTWTSETDVTYSYEWLRCEPDEDHCHGIAGEVSNQHTVSEDDQEHTLRVRVRATNTGGTASVVTEQTDVVPEVDGTDGEGCDSSDDDGDDSAAAAIKSDGGDDDGDDNCVVTGAPEMTERPAISGTVTVSETLTGSDGTWTGDDPLTFEYVWFRCNAEGEKCMGIPGENGNTHVLTDLDGGRTLRIAVHAENPVGDKWAISLPSAVVPGGVVQAVKPDDLSAPVISGDAFVGNTLHASEGSWTGTAPMTFTYRWFRCDAAGIVCSETMVNTPDYVLGAEDVGSTLRVRVRATNVAGSDSSVSLPSVVVAAAP